jgi:FkbM family methyltransferase
MESLRHSLTLRDQLLQSVLMRVRPAALASAIKKVLHVERTIVLTPVGRFYVDPVSQFASALRTGHYEPHLTFALWTLLPPGGTFVDIGANEGYFSVVASKLVGPGGRVVAVEPQARLRTVLDTNFELNAVSNVQIIDQAVSDQSGTATLHVAPDTNTGSTGLHQATRYKTTQTPVETRTLANILADARIERVDVMKMDIEGFEYEAILGAPEVFRQHRVRAFALELHPRLLAARNRSPEEIVSFLKSCGYEMDLRFEHSLSSAIWVAPPAS